MAINVIRLGFEPKTHSLEGCCSIQLSYRTNPYWLLWEVLNESRGVSNKSGRKCSTNLDKMQILLLLEHLFYFVQPEPAFFVTASGDHVEADPFDIVDTDLVECAFDETAFQ